MMKNLGAGERIKSVFRMHPLPIGKRVDLYLSEHLPDLVDEYRLATKRDITGVDEKFELYEGDIEELGSWKNSAQQRVEDVEGRIERLEYKHGIKG